SLNLIINDIVNSIPYHNNIQIIVQLTDSEIQCDQDKIKTAITNIITNAIQAIGSEVGKIIITTNDEGEKLTIKIQNTGPNIPMENLEKIFEPLFTTKPTGTGLGLVSVKNIIEQHGGAVTFQNDPVTFTIILPKHFGSNASYKNISDSANALSRIIIGQQPTSYD
ncbi:MAG: ATP-binding protein, partial [Nitrososphaerota archaeon]